jgi:DNA-binding HxlR family transcriptional regulator
MTESDETQQDIKEIKWRIENVDNKFDMLVRGNEEALQEVADLFRGDSSMAQVYLEIDGQQNQKEIADSVGTSPMTVSRKIQDLKRYGLIEKKEIRNGAIWKKSELHGVMRLGDRVDPESGWNDN